MQNLFKKRKRIKSIQISIFSNSFLSIQNMYIYNFTLHLFFVHLLHKRWNFDKYFLNKIIIILEMKQSF